LANETLRSKFAINTRMKHLGGERKHFEATIDEGAFNVHKDDLETGDLLTFEYRFFNDESHPGWAIQKKRNAHNLSAYYSEFFRIEIGKPGLLIDAGMLPADRTDPDPAELNRHPDPRRYTGGWTTIPSMRVEPWNALQQQAFNLSPANAQIFLTGRTWFHTDLDSGEHRSDASDDKPSRFFEAMETERAGYAAPIRLATSCNACHAHNGRSTLPDIDDRTSFATVAKAFDPKTGGKHAHWGTQFQFGEVGWWTLDGYDKSTVTLEDGTEVELLRPEFGADWKQDGTLDVDLGIRSTPALIGAGLLDAVPEATIRANAAASKTGGRVNEVNGAVGRFGWKAAQPSLDAQIRDALINDMGVASANREGFDVGPKARQRYREQLIKDRPKGLLPEEAVEALEAYVALLGVPPRDNPADPAVQRGAALFENIGCAQCHLPTLKTGPSKFVELANQTFHPYTDLLLHDLGDGLADESKAADARLWRTAPLWGMKNMRAAKNAYRDKFSPGDTNVTYAETQAGAKTNPVQLLHDGRARSMSEAILWHGGSARPAVDKFKGLSKTERADLEAFLWDL